MNHLLKQIAAVGASRVLDEKWLIAPSRRVGQQWIDAITRTGRSLVNTRVQTLAAMAMGLAGGRIAQTGGRILSAQSGAMLVGRIWGRHRKGGYLFQLEGGESLCQALYRTLTDLRLAGIAPEDLRPEALEVPEKAKEVAALLKLYRQELKDCDLLDRADLLTMATQALAETDGRGHLPLVLVPSDAELAALERRMIDAIPSERVLWLPVDEPGQSTDEENPTDSRLLRWLLAPADAPDPSGDGTARLFHAVGETNEVRQVLRDCLASRTALDDVEVLYTDAQTYLPLIYEMARRLESEASPPGEGPAAGQPASPGGLRVTFAEGVPVRYSRPGRVLAAWLQWVREDCPQTILVRMIQDGLLQCPQGEGEEFSFARLAGALRTVPIGFGRGRYLPQIDVQIVALERQLEADQQPDEDGEVDEEKPVRTRRRLAGLKALRELTVRLLNTCPEDGAGPVKVAQGAIGLLEGLARCVNELDNLSCRGLADDIAEMVSLLGQEKEDLGWDAWEYLASLAQGLYVGGSGPKPGHLHCAHVMSGGHTGRGTTFIVGVDDQRFPGAGSQDPILLDAERKAISSVLPTAAGDLRKRLEAFARLLARLRGRTILSYSSRDLVLDREAFPSQILLDAFRIITGQREADQSDLAAWLAPPASFMPADPQGATDAADWWLWRTCGDQSVKNPMQLVAGEFPHLGRGRHAAARRLSPEFTEFDGRVEDIPAERNPFSAKGPVLSASGLETVGRCPLAYFFKYLLKLDPPDDLEIDPAQWLDSAAFGSLLHEVFCDFMRELSSSGSLPPSYKRDRKRLEEILTEKIEEYKQDTPPPSKSAFRRQQTDLLRAIHIFLAEEERYCQDRWPQYMEAAIGMEASEPGTALDSEEPVRLSLGGGKGIRVRGQIDRIDRVGGPKGQAFEIWDYKTGSNWRFRQDPPFWSGRVVQQVIYLHLGLDRLRQVHPKASIARVGYFLPGRRGQGQRIGYTPEELDGGLAILKALCQTIAAGAFLSTDSSGDCTFCDYTGICGDLDAVAQAAAGKLQSGDELLGPWKTLRGNDEHE